MMFKVILLPLILFISLPSDCQSATFISNDILNIGYEILQHVDDHVFEHMETIWERLVPDQGSRLSQSFDKLYCDDAIRTAMGLVGVDDAHMNTCLDAIRSTYLDDITNDCGGIPIGTLQLIRDFRSQIIKMANYMNIIKSQFFELRHAGRLASEYRNPQGTNSADSLYDFVSKSGYDQSTCFFESLAGNQLRKLGGNRPYSIAYSASGEIYHAYLIIAMHLLQGYIVDYYHNSQNSTSKEADHQLESIQFKFVMHTHGLAKQALSALNGASRDIILGEPPTDYLELSYIRLNYVFSQVIVNEAHMNADHNCYSICEDYNGAEFYPPHPYDGNDKCNGTLSKCYLQELGWICPAVDQNFKRYNGIKGTDRTLGSSDNCNTTWNWWSGYRFFAATDIFHRCDVCTCICDDHYSPKTTRTFSLRPVTSDIENNMVITGVSLKEIDHIIYIEIEEGLMEDMNVVKSTQWVPVTPIDLHSPNIAFEDTYILHYGYQSTIHLDTLSTRDKLVRDRIADVYTYRYPADCYVLTGVKFERFKGNLIFGIRLTAWNAVQRKLDSREPDRWLFRTQPIPREEINMKRPDVPTKTTENFEVDGNYYVTFQPTDNEKDFGQTTVPFLDARRVMSHPAMPLSGAGVYYKGKAGYGGVIGLKLVSLDFSNFIVTELNRNSPLQ